MHIVRRSKPRRHLGAEGSQLIVRKPLPINSPVSDVSASIGRSATPDKATLARLTVRASASSSTTAATATIAKSDFRRTISRKLDPLRPFKTGRCSSVSSSPGAMEVVR